MAQSNITDAMVERAWDAYLSHDAASAMRAAIEAANLEAVREAGELRAALVEKRAAEVKLIEELAATRQHLAYRTNEADFLAAKLGQGRAEICKALASANTPRPLYASQKLATLARELRREHASWGDIQRFATAFANWMEGRDA